jgi:hypothetical protein
MTMMQRFLILVSLFAGAVVAFVGSFATCIWWYSHIGDHDGQAGIGCFVLAFLLSPIGAALAGISAYRHFKLQNRDPTSN